MRMMPSRYSKPQPAQVKKQAWRSRSMSPRR